MQERQERRIRQIRRQVDWQWLNACLGMICLTKVVKRKPLLFSSLLAKFKLIFVFSLFAYRRGRK